MTYNLADLFETVVDVVPDRTAIVAGDARLTFAQLEARANRLAHHFQACGLGAGDHIGIHAYNRVEWLEAMMAALKIRAVPININYRYVADELLYLFGNADLKALVFERQFAPVIAGIAAQLPLLQHVVVIEDNSAADVAALHAVPFEQAMAQHSDQRDFGARSPDDVYMLYTGGTTGMPKGVIWRHEDIFFGALQGGNPGGEPITREAELPALVRGKNPMIMVACAPMMHGGGEWTALMSFLGGNVFVLYCEPHFDAQKVWQLVQQEKALTLMIVGDAMARPLAEYLRDHHAELDVSSLFVVSSGGAILSQSIKQLLRHYLPHILLLDGFGASETGHNGTVMDMEGHNAAPQFTLGPHTQILDETTLDPLEPGSGHVGLLARKGHIPLGYYKDEQKTAATFKTDKQGTRWVIPGDYAQVLADGTALLLGRGSGCINSGGEKIYPEEVEAALKAHPDVYDAAVVGIPDERFGSRVCAVVQSRAGAQLALDQLQAFCEQRIARYKLPRTLVLVDEVPRTPAHKPDYRAVKALVLARI